MRTYDFTEQEPTLESAERYISLEMQMAALYNEMRRLRRERADLANDNQGIGNRNYRIQALSAAIETLKRVREKWPDYMKRTKAAQRAIDQRLEQKAQRNGSPDRSSAQEDP